MPEQLWFTEFLNHHFAGVANSLLQLVGIHPKYASAPITNAVAMDILIVLLLLAFFVLIRVKLSVDNPGGLQHTAETLEEFLADQAHGVIGHGYERYMPYAVTLW